MAGWPDTAAVDVSRRVVQCEFAGQVSRVARVSK